MGWVKWVGLGQVGWVGWDFMGTEYRKGYRNSHLTLIHPIILKD